MGGAQFARNFLESTKFSKYTKFITKWTELVVQNLASSGMHIVSVTVMYLLPVSTNIK